MTQPSLDVIYLASCALKGVTPDKARVEAMDLDQVFSFASRHMISAAVAFALESAGCSGMRSVSAIASSVQRTAVFERAWDDVRAKLEAAGIWYMPLKGAVLREMYPKYGMREFADYDILFDPCRAEDVKAIMEEAGFETGHFGTGKDDSYYRQPFLNFEMHHALFNDHYDGKLYEYFKDVEPRLVRKDGFERAFTPEDFYLYFLTHEYKHYDRDGTGLRSLMDTYVYLKRTPLDADYIAAETAKLGITEFEKQNRSLAFHLFDEEPLTPSEREMLAYFLSSGTFGTYDQFIENNIRKAGGGKDPLHAEALPGTCQQQEQRL